MANIRTQPLVFHGQRPEFYSSPKIPDDAIYLTYPLYVQTNPYKEYKSTWLHSYGPMRWRKVKAIYLHPKRICLYFDYTRTIMVGTLYKLDWFSGRPMTWAQVEDNHEEIRARKRLEQL